MIVWLKGDYWLKQAKAAMLRYYGFMVYEKQLSYLTQPIPHFLCRSVDSGCSWLVFASSYKHGAHLDISSAPSRRIGRDGDLRGGATCVMESILSI
jgi:hypothetical protein